MSEITTSEMTNGKVSVPISFLECAVCLNLVCEPVSLSCGHTFCRICLVKTLTRNRKRCPSCRSLCFNSAEDQPENTMLSEIVRSAHPQLYETRLEEQKKEKDSLRAIFPIFFYNIPLYPGESLNLHLFEPRYQLMMKRIIGTTQKFAYLPNYKDYTASVGDLALIAKVVNCRFENDGRCTLVANLSDRYVVMEHFIEEGTHGLHFCKLEKYNDNPMTEEEICTAQKLSNPIKDIVKAVLEPIAAEVTQKHGEMPPCNQLEKFSLYIAGVLPFEKARKHSLLVCKNTLERLQTCYRIINDIRNVPNQDTIATKHPRKRQRTLNN